MRRVLVHYHIFKNSGTTLDHALQRQLGKNFQTFDVPSDSPAILQSAFAERIQRHPEIRAFSSHSLRLPAPQLDGVQVMPVVFVRHPFLRLKSIYQWLMSTRLKRGVRRFLGAEAGPEGDPLLQAISEAENFPDWLSIVLDSREGISRVANAQTRMLSARYDHLPERVNRGEGGIPLFDLDRARENLSAVELLGRTEQFGIDVARFEPVLARLDIPLSLQGVEPRNVTDPDFDSPLAERLVELRQLIGGELSDSLDRVLAQDLELYSWVETRLA